MTETGARVAFIFSGYGALWEGMGVALLHQDATFRAAIREVSGHFDENLDWSVEEQLKSARTGDYRNLTVGGPAIFAVQYGLIRALAERGITPSVTVGVSFGEYAAATASGILALPETCRLVAASALALKAANGIGGTATAAISEDRAHDIVAASHGDIQIAVVMSEGGVLLAGTDSALHELGTQLAREGLYYRVLEEFPYPYHSPLMAGVCTAFRQQMDSVRTAPATVPMISTVTGDYVEGTDLDIDYWTKHFVTTTLLQQAAARAARTETVFLEVGPRPHLQTPLRTHRGPDGERLLVLPTLTRHKPGTAALDEAAERIRDQ
ncbi:acyltransferase domain-containing protein [Nocardia macrotermitis]|uniref:6-deoxyerythronolide-B synthase EryA2, modules 3 and 4 n=1 Tax=Nocardia macrotermitis TaxID=2585198 RepID=A0A7K0D3C7_9NOCA|nr:acyltransferase domain-containing protein [Nocardia macrotermitis]MQY20218.1 6-deoxyerythronolide-B synthase EryA2, modules 3 and 4 [Nocardia macrotermitis]